MNYPAARLSARLSASSSRAAQVEPPLVIDLHCHAGHWIKSSAGFDPASRKGYDPGFAGMTNRCKPRFPNSLQPSAYSPPKTPLNKKLDNGSFRNVGITHILRIL